MFAIALTLPLALAACSSSAAPVDTTPSVPTTEPTVATTPTSITTTTTTAATEPTTVEDAIRAAHTRVMTELYSRDERVDGPEAMLPLAEELTTGPLLQRIKEAVAERVASGERAVSPGYDSNIVKVTMLSTSHAQVVDCSQDRSEKYSAAGLLVVPADDFYKLRTSDMVVEGDQWRAADIFTGGDERCDPAA